MLTPLYVKHGYYLYKMLYNMISGLIDDCQGKGDSMGRKRKGPAAAVLLALAVDVGIVLVQYAKLLSKDKELKEKKEKKDQ